MAAGIPSDQSTAQRPANDPGDTARALATLLQIEREARHARSEASFRFIVVNETRRLVAYDQAVLWRRQPGGAIRIEAVSGVPDIARETPYIHWLERAIALHATTDGASGAHLVEPGSIQGQADWPEMVNGDVLWCPFLSRDGELIGGLWLTRSGSDWQTSDRALLERLADAYAHTWQALTGAPPRATRRLADRLLSGRWRMVLVTALLILMLVPVRQTALAPAEVVPLDPLIVTAPMDGVIQAIHVQPNARVAAGELLFSLDDTATRNRHEVALKAAEVAQAEYLRAARKAFQDEASKAELAMLRAEVELRQAEAQYAEELLGRIRVHAERDGIA